MACSLGDIGNESERHFHAEENPFFQIVKKSWVPFFKRDDDYLKCALSRHFMLSGGWKANFSFHRGVFLQQDRFWKLLVTEATHSV